MVVRYTKYRTVDSSLPATSSILPETAIYRVPVDHYSCITRLDMLDGHASEAGEKAMSRRGLQYESRCMRSTLLLRFTASGLMVSFSVDCCASLKLHHCLTQALSIRAASNPVEFSTMSFLSFPRHCSILYLHHHRCQLKS